MSQTRMNCVEIDESMQKCYMHTSGSRFKARSNSTIHDDTTTAGDYVGIEKMIKERD